MLPMMMCGGSPPMSVPFENITGGQTYGSNNALTGAAANAFDASSSTYWAPNAAANSWNKVWCKFVSAVALARFSVTLTAGAYMPAAAARIVTSNDGVNWAVLNVTLTLVDTPQFVSVPSAVTALYWGLEVQTTSSDPRVRNLEMSLT